MDGMGEATQAYIERASEQSGRKTKLTSQIDRIDCETTDG